MNPIPLNMHHPAPPIFPVLDKSHLFVHLPSDPQNQNRTYLHCPATGHLYCMLTGSLLRIIPPPDNNSSLDQIKDSCLLPGIPTPCTMKTFSVNTKNIDQQDSGASATPYTESNTSSQVRDVDLPILNNNAPKSNIAPNVNNADQSMEVNKTLTSLNPKCDKTYEVKYEDQPVQSHSAAVTPNATFKVMNNADEPVQANGASSLSKATSKVKHAGQPIQGNRTSVISYLQRDKNSKVKKTDRPVQGNSSSITTNNHGNKASESTTDKSTQSNSPVQGPDNSSTCQQIKSDPTSKKEKKKRSRKTKNKASSKKKNSNVFPQPKPTTSFMSNSSSNFKKPALITQTPKPREAKIQPENKRSAKNKKKSYTFYKFCLNHTVRLVQPIQIKFEDLLYPQNVSLTLDKAKYSKRTEIIPVRSKSKYKFAPKYPRKKKLPSLRFSKEDYDMIYVEDNLRKNIAKKNNFGSVVTKIFRYFDPSNEDHMFLL